MTSIPQHELRRLTAAAVRRKVPVATLVDARLAGEPLQYLEGTTAFGPLELMVDPRVLIPRPETEQLWELAVELVDNPRTVVDVGTGSGALALALKLSYPAAEVVATELSAEAAAVARANSAATGFVVEVLEGDLFEPLPARLEGSVDLIVSNPPYVAEEEWVILPEDVRREPKIALVAGDGGLAVLKRLAAESVRWLAPGGWIACEIGETQGAPVSASFGHHLSSVEVRPDLTGRDRFVIAQR